MDNPNASSSRGETSRYRCLWVWVDTIQPKILHVEAVGYQDETPNFGVQATQHDRGSEEVLRQAAWPETFESVRYIERRFAAEQAARDTKRHEGKD